MCERESVVVSKKTVREHARAREGETEIERARTPARVYAYVCMVMVMCVCVGGVLRVPCGCMWKGGRSTRGTDSDRVERLSFSRFLLTLK